ncbi:hypothetical protein C0J52_04596 [Blattella germanica]|nr:hypothetical protein C0J52_04596 [Blattella germanica]
MLHSRLSYTFVILCMFLVQIYAVEENVDAPCLNGVGDETQDMCLSETILDSLNSLGYDTDSKFFLYFQN